MVGIYLHKDLSFRLLIDRCRGLFVNKQKATKIAGVRLLNKEKKRNRYCRMPVGKSVLIPDYCVTKAGHPLAMRLGLFIFIYFLSFYVLGEKP